jgi:poly(hydroxyalkanoate) depolymerase family esterase
VAPAAGRWLEGTHTDRDGARAYKIYIPGDIRGKSLPLIVMLHGCTQDPDDFAAGTRMNFLAEAAGIVVVYPEQSGSANASRCWNWFQPADQERGQGEPALIAGLTRRVMDEYHVETRRVYVAGMSAGGAMAAILAATYPDLYAAAGVHSGLAPRCAHDLPSAYQAMQSGGQVVGSGAGCTVPLILFHGDSDPTVHPCNADRLVEQWTATGPVVSPTMQQGGTARGRSYTCATYTTARGRAVVERWTVHGGGHAWSGGNPSGSYTDPNGPDASREFVRFFSTHPR